MTFGAPAELVELRLGARDCGSCPVQSFILT